MWQQPDREREQWSPPGSSLPTEGDRHRVTIWGPKHTVMAYEALGKDYGKTHGSRNRTGSTARPL